MQEVVHKLDMAALGQVMEIKADIKCNSQPLNNMMTELSANIVVGGLMKLLPRDISLTAKRNL
jgi:hypothetical protein